jgi:hypothetical protein
MRVSERLTLRLPTVQLALQRSAGPAAIAVRTGVTSLEMPIETATHFAALQQQLVADFAEVATLLPGTGPRVARPDPSVPGPPFTLTATVQGIQLSVASGRLERNTLQLGTQPFSLRASRVGSGRMAVETMPVAAGAAAGVRVDLLFGSHVDALPPRQEAAPITALRIEMEAAIRLSHVDPANLPSKPTAGTSTTCGSPMSSPIMGKSGSANGSTTESSSSLGRATMSGRPPSLATCGDQSEALALDVRISHPYVHFLPTLVHAAMAFALEIRTCLASWKESLVESRAPAGPSGSLPSGRLGSFSSASNVPFLRQSSFSTARPSQTSTAAERERVTAPTNLLPSICVSLHIDKALARFALSSGDCSLVSGRECIWLDAGVWIMK